MFLKIQKTMSKQLSTLSLWLRETLNTVKVVSNFKKIYVGKMHENNKKAVKKKMEDLGNKVNVKCKHSMLNRIVCLGNKKHLSRWNV